MVLILMTIQAVLEVFQVVSHLYLCTTGPTCNLCQICFVSRMCGLIARTAVALVVDDNKTVVRRGIPGNSCKGTQVHEQGTISIDGIDPLLLCKG